MSRKYRNPPIVEVVCEFRFDPASAWDLAIPGLVYEQVKETFPKRRQVRQIVEVGVSSSGEGVSQQARVVDRMQFLRDDEKALIQTGPHLLAVNHLKPYPHWEYFLPLIREGYNAYRKAAEPKGIVRIGLRYINRIEISGQRMELEKYFEFRPYVGSNLPQDFGPFIVGIQISHEDSRDMLKIELGSAHVESPNTAAVMLDLDYFLTKPKEVVMDKVFEWTEVAHSHIEEVFEACIADRLRQMFEEVTK